MPQLGGNSVGAGRGLAVRYKRSEAWQNLDGSHPLVRYVVPLGRPIKPDESGGPVFLGSVRRSVRRWLFAGKIGAMIPTAVPGLTEKAPASNSERTILFADDDGQFQEFVAALLHKCGYKVIVASDGREALQKAHEFDGVIHLLLSDVEMLGMTGVELAIQLNKERPDTKILLISGLASGLLVLNNGWSFLPKPFVGDMLRDRIRDFLSEQSPIQERSPNGL